MKLLDEVIDFFTGGWLRWLVVAAVLSSLILWGCEHLINKGRQEVIAENVVQAARIVVKQGAATERVVTKYLKVKGDTEVVTKYVDREVIKYEGAKLDQSFLSNGYVRLFNTAASNAIPDATPRTDDSASTITVAQSLATVTSNYAICKETSDRLVGLQNWIQEQSQVK